jgi:hypothetical protein
MRKFAHLAGRLADRAEGNVRVIGSMASGRNSLDHYTSQVVSKNLVRRHLKESQRAMVADKIRTLKHGGDRRSENFKGPIGLLKDEPGISLAEAAKLMSVSERSVKRARVVRSRGVAALQQAVEDGDTHVIEVATSRDPRTGTSA